MDLSTVLYPTENKINNPAPGRDMLSGAVSFKK